MYGKIFSSMYEGSLVGSGPVVFALWGYCISKADAEESTVMLNPPLIASIIGTTSEEITKAIKFLTSPDENSKNTDNEGRRLLHVSGFCYFLVSHQHYRSIKSMQDVRIYEKERKRKQRDKLNVPECPGQTGTPASVSDSVSNINKEYSSNIESNDGDSTTSIPPSRTKKKLPSDNAVERCYKAYPTHCLNSAVSSGKSEKCKDKIRSILSKRKYPLYRAIKFYCRQSVKDKRYMKNFSTFLNNLPDPEIVRAIPTPTDGHEAWVTRCKNRISDMKKHLSENSNG